MVFALWLGTKLPDPRCSWLQSRDVSRAFYSGGGMAILIAALKHSSIAIMKMFAGVNPPA